MFGTRRTKRPPRNRKQPRSRERKSRVVRLKSELSEIQDYWSRKAKQKGVLTERDLQRYLRRP